MTKAITKQRPDDCIINTFFIDTINPEYHRNKYCKENCQYRCHKGLDYKKKENT